MRVASRLVRVAPILALTLAAGCATPKMPSMPSLPYISYLPYIPYVTAPAPAAVAQLADATGRGVGQATLLETRGGVRILIDVTGLPPGIKGVHIHEVGRCDPPAFDSAGAHFNPTKVEHGSSNPRGPHAGDLPNITVEADGRGHLEVTARRVTLQTGPTSLVDADGSAVVVHERADDLRTDPSGDSGARIACGVVVPAGR
jgi:Cu-Zn family superoxide dismutase